MDGASYPARYIDPELPLVDLNHRSIGDEEAIQLADELEENTTLVCLHLRGNHIGPKGAAEIGRALRRNTKLKRLSLAGNALGDEGAIQIALSLIENQSLTHLDVERNEIGDRGVEELCIVLRPDAALTELVLKRNSFGPFGTEKLADVLGANPSLTTLDLSGNKIGEQGVMKLAASLERNSTLRELSLEDVDLSDAGASKIAQSLESNMALAKLNLGHVRLAPESVSSIVARGNRGRKISISETLAGDVGTGLERGKAEFRAGACLQDQGHRVDRRPQVLRTVEGGQPVSLKSFPRRECPVQVTAASVQACTKNFSTEIGRGGFGVLYRGSDEETEFAVKIPHPHMDLDPNRMRDSFRREIEAGAKVTVRTN
jgi:Ran GTPase-activating protein (RanGAP) involved in mRNA processing and transport